MMKQKLYLTGIFLLLVNFKSFSQSGRLTLSQAWESAFSGYPGLTEKQALIQESEIQKREISNYSLPEVQLQLQNSYGTFAGSSGASFPLPGSFNVSGNNPLISDATVSSNTFGSVLLNWKIFQFGRQRKAVQAADANIAKSGSIFDASKLALQAKVSRIYLEILYSGAKRQWASDNAGRVSEILALSKTLTEAGLKPAADTLLAGSSYLQALGDLDDWNGKYEAGKIRLTEMVTLPVHEKNFSSDAFLKSAEVAERDDSVLIVNHPALSILSHQIENDKLRVQIAGRKLLPEISILAGASSRGSGIGNNGAVNSSWTGSFNDQTGNYLLGVGLTWNIRNAFNSMTEKNRVKQQLLASEARLSSEYLQLSTSLQSLNSRIAEQLKQVSKTAGAVKNARSAYELYLARYQSGLISLTELLQIQLLLQQSEKTNIEAYQQLWEQFIRRSELSGDFTYLSNHFN